MALLPASSFQYPLSAKGRGLCVCVGGGGCAGVPSAAATSHLPPNPDPKPYPRSLQKVANRDIKADNVLIGADTTPWQVKLCDFGFSVETAGPNDEAGSLVGTPFYCSPEVCAG